MTAPFPQRVVAFVAIVGACGGALLAVALATLWRSPPDPSLALAASAGAFAGGYALLERSAVTFRWRGHKLTTSLTETAIALGFLALPAGLVPVLVGLAALAIHLVSGRPAVKGFFNVGHAIMSSASAAGAYAGLAVLGVPPLVAAAAAAVVFSFFTDVMVATLFALLEGVSSLRVYADRMLASNLLALSTAIPAAVVLVGLWSLHPLATLAAVPLAVHLGRHASLESRVDRELDVRRRLADNARVLIGTADVAAIGPLVTRSCGDLLDASRARLTLADGTVFGEEFDESQADGRPPIEAPVVGRSGATLATLAVWGRPLKPRYGDDERALLSVIAQSAAYALESADALVEIAAQRDLIARQEKLSALGTLTAGVAHEINNPLTFMRLRLEITRMETRKFLDREDATEEDKAFGQAMLKGADTFQRGVDRLATLCQSLKAVAKPGDGQRAPTQVNDVVAEVTTVVRAAHKNIQYELATAPDAPLVVANAGELHQVLLNLVKNAAEALETHPEPRIAVRTFTQGGSLVLEVHDNGPGIPPDVQARLFTAFFTTKKTGTGLGLSLSRQIMVAHGGDLTVESGPDRGTTFRARLPLTPPAAPEIPAGSGS